MVPGVEGGVTKYKGFKCLGDQMRIFDAAMAYAKEGIPLVVFAGHGYGMGSSRDWAAKGTRLLGIKAVIAKSFERIHRSNLIGMGVLPLQLDDKVDISVTGEELVSILSLKDLQPGGKLGILLQKSEERLEVDVTCRIDTQQEMEYYRHGSILHFVLRNLM